MKYKLKVIVASTRPGRKGPAIASWFVGIVDSFPEFELELIDLQDVNLPFLDEAAHPRLQKYEKDHTKRWSTLISEADAFVLVTPEYNHGPPATIINALDFLSKEWVEKPMGFVSYGGISAGTRAVVRLVPTVANLGMMPIPQAVNIPFFTQFIDSDGIFKGSEKSEKAARNMIKELIRWTEALKGMRDKGRIR